jgi:hypothetical protein
VRFKIHKKKKKAIKMMNTVESNGSDMDLINYRGPMYPPWQLPTITIVTAAQPPSPLGESSLTTRIVKVITLLRPELALPPTRAVMHRNRYANYGRSYSDRWILMVDGS